MVLMAGMLPAVECARRRRVRQAGAAAEAPCVTRNDHAHLGSSGPKQRSSSVCKEPAHAWTLDSNAREAKERLDQKLRGQRESVVKRHHSTGSLRLPAKPHLAASASASASDHLATATATASALQREVFTKKGGGNGRRFRWGRRKEPPSEQQAECAVCLEEFRAGDVLAQLPCGHRFHWACAVPWVQAASRCPFCRAAVHLTAD